MSQHRRARAIAALLSVSVASSSLLLGLGAPHAQVAAPAAGAPAPAAPGTFAEAKTHMDKGQELYLQKNFAAAAAEFHTAFEIKPWSTFLFNEGLCHEKLREHDKAIALFEQYLRIDPGAPDHAKVQTRIERLKVERDAAAAAAAAGSSTVVAVAGGDAGVPPAGGDAGTGTVAAITDTATAASLDEMRSVVVIESTPTGAPVELWQRTDPTAAKYELGGTNHGWTKVSEGATDMQTSLPLGTYHVVIPKFKDYRATDTDIIVAPATISQFKANLSQGAFFGVLKVRSESEGIEIRGAHVLVKEGDKADAKFIDRGTTPYDEALESGKYVVRVEQPGFVATEKTVEITHGAFDEHTIQLPRTEEGTVRFEVTGTEAAQITIDGVPVGVWIPGAKVEKPVKNGEHKVVITAEDRKTFEGDVEVPKGRLVIVHAEMKPSVPRGSAWGAAIFSGLFLGTGIYFGIESNGLKSDLQAAQAAHRLDQNDPRITRGQIYAIGADAGFAIGGVLAIIAIYNFVKDPLPPSVARSDAPRDLDALPVAPRPTARLVPITSPTFTGLAIVGEF
ncbi:MAG: PEGA domain-containing protein [Polyangiales bacterium]